MFESVKYSKCTTKEFLDTLVNASEIYAEYEKKNDIYIECLDRLLDLKDFGFFIKVLRNHSKLIFNNFEKYEKLCTILSQNLKEFKNNGCLDELLSIFWDLLEKCTELFQKYLVCRLISTMVSFEGKFPNKTRAISYLKVLYDIFDKSECYNNCLIVVHYMEKLGVINLSEEEISFLNACARIKQENVSKELLCGMRSVDVQNVFKNTERGNRAFLKNKNWEKLIEAKETGTSVALDVDFVSFLLKNDFSFEIKNDELFVGEYRRTGLTGRIFAVAKEYDTKKDITSRPIVSEEVSEDVSEESTGKNSVKNIVKNEIKTEEPVSVVKYVDRFSKPRREFKWFYSNSGYVFEDDDGLEERNALKKDIFDKFNKEFKRRKQVFEEKKELIYQLSEKLKLVIEEKIKKEREESMKRLKEQSLVSSSRNLWSTKRDAIKVNSILQSTSTCSSVVSNSYEDINRKRKAMAAANSCASASMHKTNATVKRSYVNKFNEELKKPSDSNSETNDWGRKIKK